MALHQKTPSYIDVPVRKSAYLTAHSKRNFEFTWLMLGFVYLSFEPCWLAGRWPELPPVRGDFVEAKQ